MQYNYKFNDFLTAIRHISGLTADYAIEAIGGSAELYVKMLSRFIRLLPSNIDEMDNSLSTGDMKTFSIKTHGIKGSLRQMGYSRLAKTSEDLEKAAKANDDAFCLEYYGRFKDELLCFSAQLSSALESAGMVCTTKLDGHISDHLETLTRARTALENYDSLLAADILSPLGEISFGNNADDLLAKATEAIESFQPLKALEYITDVIRECPR